MKNGNVDISMGFQHEDPDEFLARMGGRRVPEAIDVRAIRAVAYLLMKLRWDDKAETLARKAVELDSFDIENHVLLLEVLTCTFHPSPAIIDVCRRGLELDPNNLALRLGLVEPFLEQGELDDALKEARIAVERHPDSAEAHAWVSRSLGMLAERSEGADQLSLYEERLVELRTVLKLDPAFPRAHEWAANTLEELERTDESSEFRLRAMQMDDDGRIPEHSEETAASVTDLLIEVFGNEDHGFALNELVEAVLCWRFQVL